MFEKKGIRPNSGEVLLMSPQEIEALTKRAIRAVRIRPDFEKMEMIVDANGNTLPRWGKNVARIDESTGLILTWNGVEHVSFDPATNIPIFSTMTSPTVEHYSRYKNEIENVLTKLEWTPEREMQNAIRRGRR